MRKRLLWWLRRRSTKGLIGLVAAGVVLVALVGGGVYAALGGFSQTPLSSDINLQSGLVGWWKLNGNTKDATPYADDSTISGGVTPATDREGTANGAYAFDGTSGYLSAGNPTPLQKTYSNFTWSAWVKPTTVTKDQMFLSKQSGNYLRITGSKVFNSFMIGGAQKTLGGTTTLVNNNWYLLSATYDGSAMRVYVNGVLDGTLSSLSGTLNFNTGAFDIGHWTTIDPRFFVGSLDDVRLYNRALSVAEITALYQQYDAQVNAASGESGLIGWWKMDGNTKDSTPYADDGTIVGGVSAGTDREGTTNGAYVFDGTSGYIEYGNPATLKNLTTGSWSAWISTTSITTQQVFLSHQSADYMRTNTNGTLTVSFRTGGTQHTVTSSAHLIANKWTLVTTTYDGSTMKLYVNGQLDNQATGLSGTLAFSNGNFEIGRYNSATPLYFSGSIDDARLYNRALSASEILTQYNSYNSQINLNSSPTNNQTVNLNSGLVAYWPFNGNAKDATPYQRNGTVTGATLITDRKGRANSAYSFNGTSGNYISTPTTFATNGAITVSAWINLTNTTTNGMIAVQEPANTQWELMVESANLRWVTGAYNGTMSCAGALTAGSWHHVVGEQTGTTATLYLDGVQCKTGTQVALPNGTGGVTIARYSGGYNFNGSIDDVRIYNRALSATEITALSNNYY